VRDDIEQEKEAYVRRWYLEHPEGIQQLKQMIEEAEKRPPTIEEAMSAYANCIRTRMSPGTCAEARDAIKAAAQREYGKTSGQIGSMVSEYEARIASGASIISDLKKEIEKRGTSDPLEGIDFRDMDGELSLCDNWAPADKRGKELHVGYIQRDSDFPMGIALPRADVVRMYEYITRWLALSTLEEK
jgi:hypothetical protein